MFHWLKSEFIQKKNLHHDPYLVLKKTFAFTLVASLVTGLEAAGVGVVAVTAAELALAVPFLAGEGAGLALVEVGCFSSFLAGLALSLEGLGVAALAPGAVFSEVLAGGGVTLGGSGSGSKGSDFVSGAGLALGM